MFAERMVQQYVKEKKKHGKAKKGAGSAGKAGCKSKEAAA